jgi:hypothetical protein
MGFKFESVKRSDKNAPKKASGMGMILVFITAGIAIFLGWWVPQNYSVRDILPFTATWSTLTLQIVTGLVAFILLQFVVVLISGILFPPPPEELYDKDGLYLGKNKK